MWYKYESGDSRANRGSELCKSESTGEVQDWVGECRARPGELHCWIAFAAVASGLHVRLGEIDRPTHSVSVSTPWSYGFARLWRSLRSQAMSQRRRSDVTFVACKEGFGAAQSACEQSISRDWNVR